MGERTLRGKVADRRDRRVDLLQARRGARSPSSCSACEAILAACADAGIDPRDVDGFASYSNDRNDPSRIAAALGCRELTLLEHAVGRRRGRRLGARSATRAAAIAAGHRGRAWSCTARSRRVSSAASARARDAKTVSGDPALMAAVRADVAGADVRHARDAAHARARHQPGGVPRRRARLLPPRADEPARGHVRPAAHAEALRRVALDRRAVPPVRLLPGERRRGRAGARLGRARARPAPAAGLRARRGAGLGEPRGRAARTTSPTTRPSSFKTVAPRLYEMAGRRRRATSTWCRATRTSPAAW